MTVGFFLPSVLSNTWFSPARLTLGFFFFFWWHCMRQVSLYKCVHVCACVYTCNWCCGGVYEAVFVVILRSLKLYAKPHKRTCLNGPFSSPCLLLRPWTSLNIFCFAGRGARPVFLEHSKLFFNFSKPLLVRTLSSPALLSPQPCDICFDPDSWQAPAMVFVRRLDSPSHRVDVTLSRKAKVPFSPLCNGFVVVVLRGNFLSAGKVETHSGQPLGKKRF